MRGLQYYVHVLFFEGCVCVCVCVCVGVFTFLLILESAVCSPLSVRYGAIDMSTGDYFYSLLLRLLYIIIILSSLT